MHVDDPTLRFSNRVRDYVRFRPSYPHAVLSVLEQEIGLCGEWIVADMGSGTGISSALFVDNGIGVIGVEPNPEMRSAAEKQFDTTEGFRSVAGRAESTGLDAGSVDLVVAGQSFHWFDPTAAKTEFTRILRSPPWVAVFWNTRLLESNPFDRAYEALLQRFGTDYESVRHDQSAKDALGSFFEGEMHRRSFPNQQVLDREGLEGRLRSSSYTPAPGHPDHVLMLRAARELFTEYKEGGTVSMRYQTELYFGRVA